MDSTVLLDAEAYERRIYSPYCLWDIIEPHRKRAYLNYSQTLEMLAERGGLDWYEILCVLLDKPLFGGIPLKTGINYKPYVMKAIDKLKKE